MVRHSQHANDRSYYSNKERADAGYQTTKKDVLGTDCFLPFGLCALTLKAPKDPVATPDGWIYDRKAILEALVSQKAELQEKSRQFEEQERRKKGLAEAEKRKNEMSDIGRFIRAEKGIVEVDGPQRGPDEPAGHHGHGQGPDRKRSRKEQLPHVDKAGMRDKAFWAAVATRTATPDELKKVDTATRCPMSGKKLRMRDLMPMKLQVADEKLHSQGGGRGVYKCAVTGNPILFQQAVLLKPSGHVVLESCLEDCVYRDKVCPVTGIAIEGPKDVLKLHVGGSGFAAHNDVEATSFSVLRSYTSDARTQQGHLPRAGYTGLH